MHPKLTIELLKRRAVVYIRQSSPGQVVHNLESQRRQYSLADHARQLGFHEVQVNYFADLNLVPIYVRAGAILPFCALEQWVGQLSPNPLTFNCYPSVT